MKRMVLAVLTLVILVAAWATWATEPPVAVGPPYPIEAYLEIRQAFDARWLADGQTIVYRTNVSGTAQVWRVPADGGEARQLTDYPDAVDYAVPSPTDADLVLFSKGEGGNERSQLYFMRADGTGVEKLTGPDTATFAFGAWSRDGKLLAYRANTRNPAAFDVYVLDVATRKPRLAMQKDAFLDPVAFSPGGDYLVVSELESSANNNLYLVDLAATDKPPVLLTPHVGYATYEHVRWPLGPRQNEGFYLVSNLGREFAKLAFFSVTRLKMEYLDDGPWDAEMLTFSLNGVKMAYSLNVNGYSRIALSDEYKKIALPAIQLSEGVIYDAAFSPKGDRLALTVSSATQPADIYVAQTGTGAARRLTFSSTGGVPPASFVKPQAVLYDTSDDGAVPAWLYLPQNLPAETKAPCLMYLHGGPEGQERPDFYPIFQYFLNRGYAVFAPNVRGSTGYGKRYMYMDDVGRRLDSVRDMAEAVTFIKKNVPQIDPARIALFGGSYGGFMVLSGLTEYPNLFAAGVCVVGIANFETFLEQTAPYRRKLREAEYGNLLTDRELLKRISPIHRIDRIRAPLMVIHGANDPRVPVGEARQIVEALQARQQPVEFLLYEDEGHGLTKLKNKLDAYPKMAAFLDRYLRTP